MARLLHNVANFCSSLSSEKLTARKQAASNLAFLLKDDQVITALDSVKDETEKSDIVTWDGIIHEISNYVYMEIGNGNDTKTTEALDKRNKEAAELYQYAVQMAEKRNCLQKSSPIYTHVLTILSSVACNSSIIVIYTNMLYKAMLHKKKHCCEIGVNRWHEFVKFYFKMLLEPVSKNHVLFGRVIKQLSNLTNTMPYTEVDTIASYFLDVFKNNKHTKNLILLELLLNAMNNFVSASSANAQFSICRLGETLFSLLTCFWNYKVFSLQVQLIHFFIILLNAQDKIEDNCFDAIQTKKYHQDLYELVYLEFQELKNKNIQNRSICDTDEMKSLAAAILNKVVSSAEHLPYYLETNVFNETRVSKKTKMIIKSPWDALIEGITDNKCDRSFSTWLEVLKQMLGSTVFTKKQLHLIMSLLIKNLNEKPRAFLTSLLLETLQILIENYFTTHGLTAELQKHVTKLWDMLSFYVSDNTQKYLYSLIDVIVKIGFMKCATDAFNYILNDRCTPMMESMKMLFDIIQVNHFPENVQQLVSRSTSLKDLSLRKQLISWLLPIEEGILFDLMKNSDRENIHTCSMLLITLVSSDPVDTGKSLQNEYVERYKKNYSNVAPHFDQGSEQVHSHRKYSLQDNTVSFLQKRISDVIKVMTDKVNSKILSETQLFDSVLCLSGLSAVIIKLCNYLNQYFDGGALCTVFQKCANTCIGYTVDLLKEILPTGTVTLKRLIVVNQCLRRFKCAIGNLCSSWYSVKKLEGFVEFLLHNIQEKDLFQSSQLLSYTLNMSAAGDLMNDNTFWEELEGAKNYEKLKLEEQELCSLSCEILLHFLFTYSCFETSLQIVMTMLKENAQFKGKKLIMLSTIVKVLKRGDCIISSRDCILMVNCIRNQLSFFRYDQVACKQLLSCIKFVIRFLQVTTDKEVVEQSRLVLIKIVEAFWSSRHEKYSPCVRKKIASVLQVLALVDDDDNGMWKLKVQCFPSTGSQLHMAADLLFAMLLDEDITVKMNVAARIGNVLHMMLGDNLEKHFISISKVLDRIANKLKEKTGKIDSWKVNLTITEVMKHIILGNVNLERKALWLLFEFARTGSLKHIHVEKVLIAVSKVLKYDNLMQYIQPRLGYLIHNTLKHNINYSEFPVSCLGISQLEFFKNYYKDIIPYFILVNNLEAVREIQEHFKIAQNWNTLLIDCFASIMTLLLPLYCNQVNNAHIEASNTMHMKGLENLRVILTTEVFNHELKYNVEEIVVNLLHHLNDDYKGAGEISKYTEQSDCSPYYPSITSSDICNVLSHFASGYKENEGTISIFIRYPDVTASILMRLAEHVHNTKTFFDRITALKSYCWFSMFLISHLKDFQTSCGNYIIREFIHRSLYFMESKFSACQQKRIDHICFDILDHLCEEVSKCKYALEELQKYASHIIDVLYNFIQHGSQYKVSRSFQLLQFLFANDCVNTEILDIAEISVFFQTFSGHQMFPALKKMLLNLQTNPPDYSRMLAYLVQQLNQEKSEKRNIVLLERLKKLLYNYGSKIFVSSIILESLIETLTTGYHTSKNKSNILIVDCLGLLGMVVVSYEKDWQSPYGGASENNQYGDIIRSVIRLCVSEDANTSYLAFQSLHNMLVQDDLFLTLEENKSLCYVKGFVKNKKQRLQNKPVQPGIEANLVILPRDQLSIHDNISHEEWLKKFAAVLFRVVQNNFLLQTRSLCQVHYDFGNLCLPVILKEVIQKENHKKVMNQFFNEWVKSFVQLVNSERLNEGTTNKMTVLIHLISVLRKYNMSEHNTPWDNNFWLAIDYNEYAEAAFHCSLYYTAAMFLEISYDTLSTTAKKTMLAHSSTHANDVTDLYCKIYENIGEEDYIYGLSVIRSSLKDARLQQYQLQKNFQKALLMTDVKSSTYKSCSDVPNILMKCGLHHSALMYLKGMPTLERKKLSEVQYEAAWRNSVWNDPELRCSHGNTSGFHMSIYRSINSLHSWDIDQFSQHVRDVKLHIVDCVTSKYLSVKKQKYLMSQSFTINQLETIGISLLRGDITAVRFPSKILYDFDYYEPCLSVVCEALKIACLHTPTNTLKELVQSTADYMQICCKESREVKRYEVAEKFISNITLLENYESLPSHWKLEESKLYWDRGESIHAMQLLESLRNQTEQNKKRDLIYPVVLSLYGHWLGETRSQDPVHIMDNYLQPAIDIMEKESYSGTYSPIHAYYTLAKYADTQYQNLCDYMKSHIYEQKQAVIKTGRVELENYKVVQSRQNDSAVKRHYKNLEKQCIEDEEEAKKFCEDQERFLEKAVHNYIKCLQCGDKYDLEVLRLCALWFEHYSVENVNNVLQNGLQKIESRKFLIIMYQIAARLGTSMTNHSIRFKETLEKIVKRCISDHPHHSSFILLALCNADAHDDKPRKKGRIASKQNDGVDQTDQDRIHASKIVFENVRKERRKYVQQVEMLSRAYLELADWDINHLKNEKGPFKIPEQKLVRQMHCLNSVSIPTIELQIDPSCKYENILYITKFDTEFNHAGGINLPKIISCLGSDGKIRRQLIKGRDDLRQDAVMQQVFGLVNLFLASHRNTKQKALRMKTYKVVPLSRKSGLMEWCDGTIPLGNYLIGDRTGLKGAHQKYYPKDWSVKDCRKRLTEATSHGGSRSKHTVFLEIEKHFHPVFRHFFLEKFQDPSVWFAKRLSYTKSVAVSSVVGYIVGLGDRHCQNILVDCNTAEIVHIDLGVAFEQGRLLPTPETIPFRLTRDIIDGMGVMGIEGVYRRCSEQTLNVIRVSKEAILTIVEVLLYDPLSAWTISNEKAKKLQSSRDVYNATIPNNTNLQFLDIMEKKTADDESRNKMAERVLLRLKQKLSGSDSGAFLAVEGQINYLIQEARSTKNLCNLFPGWQPWL